ncbi:TonB-dependent receptor [Phenylobacterium sp. SCN 70-31]|uniref:TonB-dependent receptor domain-containing protein n=1 Tax=Phenylobacterium sp. SCN 70-31 TaxID=1660129 RepID=UPI0025FE5E26|nr:TonB-dependent receptor [Phenylobacterium sp. SCN 70-31]
MLAAVAGVGMGLASVTAHAAPARIQFHVPPQTYAEALLDVAQQANITLIGAGACTGRSAVGLQGPYTVEQALERLLAGAPCRWRLIAPGAVEISPLPEAPAPRLSPPVSVAELLVTATKRVRNARELAVAVTAVPRNDLRASGASDAADAAGQLAGVLATNLGPGRNKLLLRGLADGAYTGRARSIVATYLDDVPINYNAPDPDLRLVDVDRVEVARGPQGALYGAGSLGGVYRIVARRPNLSAMQAEVRATGALTRSGTPSAAVEGYANYPVFEDRLGLRLSAYQEIQGGYLDDISQDRENVDRTERRGARLIVLYQPDDNWSVALTAAGQHLRSQDTHYTSPGLGLKRSVRIPEPHVNDITLLTTTLKRSWGWGELVASGGYIRHAYSSLYDATATQDLYTSFARTSAYSERNRTRMLVQDVYLASRGAGAFQWLGGLYGSDTRIHAPTEFLAQIPNLPNIPVYGDTRRDHVREVAAYGEASWMFARGWTVALGGRAFHIDTRTRSAVVSERFPPRDFDRNASTTGLSPKLSIQWEPGSGHLIYAVASEGYRPGGLNSGGAVPLPEARETFRPDRIVNYEIGAKTRALDGRLAVSAAVFYADWEDIQTDQFRPSGIAYTTNAGDAHILGVESEVSYRGPYGLTVQLNGRLARTRTSNPNRDFTNNLVHALPGAPSTSAGALVSWEREIREDWRLNLLGQVNYVGSSHVSFDAAAPKTGGYIRSKISAELVGDRYGVQVFVLNPFDSLNDTFAFGNPFNPNQIRQITPLRPRTLGVTVSAAF